jgi:SAM-dependent methyltransferase
MYQQSAATYDAVFASRHDFPAETARILELIRERKSSVGNRLLDVACGTGAYLPYISPSFEVTGLDLSGEMLAIARQRHPEVPFYHADLVEFDLGQQFDVIVCLGSSIGYARTLPRLHQAIRTMAQQLVSGGVVAVEPWFSPDVWEAGRLTTDLTDLPDLKVARVLVSGIDESGTVSILDIHHLVATQQGVDSFVERHEMGLFTHDEHVAAFEAAGLEVSHDPLGLIGRGLYIGVRRDAP